jgi:hypothetical protein
LYIRAVQGVKQRDKRTSHLANRVMALCPWLGDSDRPALRVWCQFEWVAEQVFLELKQHGLFTKNEAGVSEARRLVDDFRKLRMAQLSYSAQLGLTVAARAAIKAGSGKELDLPTMFTTETASETPSAASEAPKGYVLEPENPAGEAPLAGRPILNGDDKRN